MMIRAFEKNDLAAVLHIWLDTNIKAHHFIPEQYWTRNYRMVKDMLPQAEIYVYENDDTGQIDGFVGLTDSYIAGIFVTESAQSKGVGKLLLDHAKKVRTTISLSVYQKNIRAIHFYQREQFVIESENIDEGTNEKEFIMNWTDRRR